MQLHRLPNPAPDGTGIRIGHIDTGHTLHPELNFDTAFDSDADWDTIDGDNNARDPMLSGSSHGTATASIITSARNTASVDANNLPTDRITDVAPSSHVVSVRAIDSVVIVFQVEIAQAVWHCIQQGVHVITMSLGGNATPFLEHVVAHAAYRENIVVCAAAGNCWPFVVFPAAYPEAIACGGVGLEPGTENPRIWTGSAQGPAVDISAPAENVYVADFTENGDMVIRPSEGTSFATSHVAGIAALWLERHGRDFLLEKYAGSASLADVFKRILKETAQRPPVLRPGGAAPVEWDTARNGAGIIDAAAILSKQLPERIEFQRDWRQWKRMDDLAGCGKTGSPFDIGRDSMA